jgi:hypothetical protein
MVTRLASRDGRAIEVAEIVAAVGEAPSGLGFWATGVTKKKDQLNVLDVRWVARI